MGKETCFTRETIDQAWTKRRSLSGILFEVEAGMTSRDGYLGFGAGGKDGDRRRLPKRAMVLLSRRSGERSARRCFIDPEGEDVDFWRSREGVEVERGRGLISAVDGKAPSNNNSGEVWTLSGLFHTED